jgi:hypothetical protein
LGHGDRFALLTPRQPAVAKTEEGFLYDQVEEPAAEKGDGRTDPEGGIAVVGDAAGAEEFVGKMDELFMGEIDRIGEGGDQAGYL